MRQTRWLKLAVTLALAGAGCTAARASDDEAPAAPDQGPRAANVPKPKRAPEAPAPKAAPTASAPGDASPHQPPDTERACIAARAAIAAELTTGEPRLTRPLQLSTAQLRCLTRSVPGEEGLSEISPFGDDDIDRALKRGQRSRGAIHVWHIEPAVFVWAPVPEQRLLVISGQANSRGAISVLRLAPDGSVEHLASTLLEEDEPGIALGSSEQYPRNLLWTTCYDCPGAGGNIRFEDDASVSFLYR